MIAYTIQKSKYKGVRLRRNRITKEEFWEAHGKTDGLNWSFMCKTEREAAKAYDLVRIRKGKKPVNILKKCTSQSTSTVQS